MKIYYAHPAKQNELTRAALEVVTKLQEEVINGISIIDPFEISPNVEGDPAQLQLFAKSILDANKTCIYQSDLVIANIDDRDIGVIWEMGYAHALGIPIISISASGYGNNIMINESVIAHITDVISDPGQKRLESLVLHYYNLKTKGIK